MNSTEVMYTDGSTSKFDNAGSFHSGQLAILRIQLKMCQSALEVYIKSNGKMQITSNGAALAIRNVLEPIMGTKYPRSMNGKRLALADCIALLADIESGAVVLELEESHD